MPGQDEYADQKAKAEADTATAKAVEAQASADLAAANARKAAAEASKLEADARAAAADATAKEAVAEQSAQAEADKSTAEAQNSAAVTAKSVADADKAAADADKAKADARTAAASATTAEAKAGIPDVPSLPKIDNPEDKSVNVQDTGGAGTANYMAAQALEWLGMDVGAEVAWALHLQKESMPRRYVDPRIEALPIRRTAWEEDREPSPKVSDPQPNSTTGQASGEKEGSAQQKHKRTVWLMDSMTPSESAITLVELRSRLRVFTSELNDTLPLVTTSGERVVVRRRKADAAADLLNAALSGHREVMELAGGFGPAALNMGGWAVSTGAGLVNFGVELVGALRSKYALYGRQVNLNRQAMLSAIAGVLLGLGASIRWPRFSFTTASPLIGDFTTACQARDDLDARLQDVAPKDPLAKMAHDRAKKLLTAFDTYASSILTTPTGASHSPFLEAALFEASLPPASQDRQDVLLFADISAQGADAMTGYGVAKGTSAAFLGFVQAYFVATDRSGAVLWAGTTTVHANGALDLGTGQVKVAASTDPAGPALFQSEAAAT